MPQIYLTKHRASRSQRAHFALFIPSAPPPLSPTPLGTKIHVVGLPMAGFTHEIKHDFQTGVDDDLEKMVPLGDFECEVDKIEGIALGVAAPRKCENFMMPVNDTTNRRCQEWTMDVVRKLVEQEVLAEDAVGAVQAERDDPSHGIGLRAVKLEGEEGIR